MQTKVLITNGDNIRSLIFLRSLAGKSDIDIHVSGETWFAACNFSKYCRHYWINANPKKHPELFLRQMSEYVRRNSIDVIIPVNADEIELILRNRGMFPHSAIPFVDYSLISRVNDKWEFFRLANRMGLPVPRTVISGRTAEKIDLKFPVIIKLRRSSGSKGVRKADNYSQLEIGINELARQDGPSSNQAPIIQEYLKGQAYCASALCRNGKVESVFVYRVVRQSGRDYGSSTCQESVYDREISGHVKKFLSRIKWHGIAQFDIIRSEKGVFFIEMNPRLYTSLGITVKAGLNYPYFLCRINNKLRIGRNYAVGIRSRLLLPDLAAFLKSGTPGSKDYSLSGFLKSSGHSPDDVSLPDFLPAIPLAVKFIRGKLL